MGKYPEVDIALSTGMSYFVFFAGHGVIVLVRHSLDLVNSATASGHNHALEKGGDVTTRIAKDDYHSKEIRVSEDNFIIILNEMKMNGYIYLQRF